MKTKTFTAMGALFAVALLAGCSSHSMSGGNAMAGSQRFVQEASNGNNFEIASSKLALKKSKNAEVRAFAAKMVRDHSKTATAMQSAVAASSVDSSYIVKGLDDDKYAMLQKLKSESGKSFDRDYINDQRNAHSDAVRLFRHYKATGKSASLRQFAMDTLPDLEAHERRIYNLQP